MISLRQLRYLSALAEHRHFGRAAAACAVTQPALSMQIRDMEALLGVDLVERRPGEVTLTEIGFEVVRRGERVLAEVRDIADFARHRASVLSGRMRLGVIPTLAPYILPKILPALRQHYPHLHLELREAQTDALLAELAHGRLDCLMLALPVPGDVATMHLFDDAFLLAVPADDPRPPERPLDADDIDRSRLILLEEGHCLRDQALSFCARRGEAPIGLEATSLATVMQMVANGYGITLVPRIAADAEVRDGRVRLLRFRAGDLGRAVGLAWRKTSPRKADFVALGEVVKEAVQGAPSAASAKKQSVRAVAK